MPTVGDIVDSVTSTGSSNVTLSTTKNMENRPEELSTNPNNYIKVSNILSGKIEQMHFAPDGGYKSYTLPGGTRNSSSDDNEKLHQKTFQYDSGKTAQYPKSVGYTSGGKAKYEYTITIQNDIRKAIQAEKKNLNIPSAYSRLELNKLFHRKFNQFRVQYQDYFLNGTVGFVVFTRPDLNLYDALDSVAEQIQNDPSLSYLMYANPETPKLLTRGYSGNHHFNPLLSNTIMSLDVSDENIDTLETGETFTGFKTQYAKSNIRSMTAGTISLSFPETYNMNITHLHQLWCGYESAVYRGSLKPKEKYIWRRELDYACDIYYFLLDIEDMIIRYWCKYTGCFPLNVNKSAFSYSGDSPVQHPSLSVSYAYFAREDMNLVNLNEFNLNAGGLKTNFRYKAPYMPSLGASGNTWSGVPFVIPTYVNNGFDFGKLYSLRFSPDGEDFGNSLLNAWNKISSGAQTLARTLASYL